MTTSLRMRVSIASLDWPRFGAGKYLRLAGNDRDFLEIRERPCRWATAVTTIEFRTNVPLIVESPTTYTARPPRRSTRAVSERAFPISHTYRANKARLRLESTGFNLSRSIIDPTHSASRASLDDVSVPTLSPGSCEVARPVYPIHTSENLLHLKKLNCIEVGR